MNPRLESVNIITEILNQKKFINRILRDRLTDSSGFEKREDRRLVTSIVYGTIRNYILLQEIIKRHVRSFYKLPLVVKIILCTGAYQIFFLFRIPEYAIINESVELAKSFGQTKMSGLVNAVLRNLLKRYNREITNFSLSSYNEIKRFSLKYSTPEWIVKEIRKRFSGERTEPILKALNSIKKISFRFLKLVGDKDFSNRSDIKDEIEPGQIFGDCFSLKNPENSFEFIRRFKHCVIVQDQIATLPARLMDLKEGMNVLDMCAAPGFKSQQILQERIQGLTVYLNDIDRERVRLIKENFNLWGVINSKSRLINYNGFRISQYLKIKFDRILLDAPCSNLGVINSRPEIKIFRKPEDIKRLSGLQLELLEGCARVLKSGGKIVYSVCTFTLEETELVVKKFLKKNRDFSIVDFNKKLPEVLRKYNNEGKFQIMPDDLGTSGFFIVVFVKKNVKTNF